MRRLAHKAYSHHRSRRAAQTSADLSCEGPARNFPQLDRNRGGRVGEEDGGEEGWTGR